MVLMVSLIVRDLEPRATVVPRSTLIKGPISVEMKISEISKILALLNVTLPVGANEPALASLIVPAVMKVPPLYVLFPVNIKTPDP